MESNLKSQFIVIKRGKRVPLGVAVSFWHLNMVDFLYGWKPLAAVREQVLVSISAARPLTDAKVGTKYARQVSGSTYGLHWRRFNCNILYFGTNQLDLFFRSFCFDFDFRFVAINICKLLFSSLYLRRTRVNLQMKHVTVHCGMRFNAKFCPHLHLQSGEAIRVLY